MKLSRFCVNERVFQTHRSLKMCNRRIVVLLRRIQFTRENFIGDRQNRTRRVRREQRAIERLVRQQRIQLRELLFGLSRLTLAEERRAARVMPYARQVGAYCRRLRLAQHLVPVTETRQRVVGHDAETGEQRYCFQSFIIDLRSCFARRLDCEFAVSFRGRREPKEVQVVRIVGHRIEALRATLRDVVFISGNGHDVALGRISITPDALINVRGHVDHVTGGRHQGEQAIGGRFGFARLICLHQMDVEMQGAGVVRVVGYHLFSQRDDL